MRTRNLLLFAVSVLGMVDVILPVPILGIILIVVLIHRPPWFFRVVRDVYGAGSAES